MVGVYNKKRKLVYVIENEYKNIIKTTPDHKFLSYNPHFGEDYKIIKNIINTNKEIFCVPTSYINADYLKGWICGYFQHDGCFVENKTTHRINALSDKIEEIQKIKQVLIDLGLHPRSRKVFQNNYYYFEISLNTIKDYNTIKKWLTEINTETKKKGWIAGAIDADGWYGNRDIRYSQSYPIHQKNINIIEKYCKELNIKYTKSNRGKKNTILKDGRRIIAKNDAIQIRFSKNYVFVVPSLLKYKLNNIKLTLYRKRNKIKLLKKQKQVRVYDIQTETGNFIANGFFVHNCGSFAESGIAMEHKVPIYLITNMAKKELPKSLLQIIAVSGGEVFNSLHDYLKFLDEKYHLKRHEEHSKEGKSDESNIL